jgi:hypothetical protein
MTALNRAATLMIGLLAFTPMLSHATTVPFMEDFASDVANWGDNTGLALVDHVGLGGPDGSAYASAQFALAGLGGESVVLFRGQDEFNSSGGAFTGNWIADGVGTFSAYVRHDAPLPLNFFTRFSGPANHPGATAVRFAPVLPNTWTLMEFDIEASNPAFVTFEGTDFNTVFSNIGHVQIGVSAPEALDAVSTSFAFDIDGPSVSAIPEPASWILVAGSMAAGVLRRRPRAG